MPTTHIGAELGDFAETCLCPGDPLRAKWIAETYLTDVKLVNEVRNMLGYTGTYTDEATGESMKISVMAHGMGVPSATIYFTELVRDFGVKQIIRIGSCGTAMYPMVKKGDLVVANACSTDSNVPNLRWSNVRIALAADFDLLEASVIEARKLGVAHHVGPVVTTDVFYTLEDAEYFHKSKKHRQYGIEMEGAALYGVAQEFAVRAVALCSVSDEIRIEDGKPDVEFVRMSAEERQISLKNMVMVALRAAFRFEKAQQKNAAAKA